MSSAQSQQITQQALQSTEQAIQNKQMGNALSHAAKIMGGWFTIGLTARMLLDLHKREQRRKNEQQLQSLLNAETPVASADLSSSDEDAILRQLGGTDPVVDPNDLKDGDVQKLAEAGTLHKAFDNFVNPLPTPPGKSSLAGLSGGGGATAAHILLTASALVLGGIGGWAVADKLSQRRYAEQLNADISKGRRRLEQGFAKEYRAARGLSSPQDRDEDKRDLAKLLADARQAVQEGEQESPVEQLPMKSALGAEPAAKITVRPEAMLAENGVIDNVTGAAKPLYMLYAAGAFILAAAGTKAWADKRDVNRKRLGKLKEYYRQQNMSKRPPVLLQDPLTRGLEATDTAPGQVTVQDEQLPLPTGKKLKELLAPVTTKGASPIAAITPKRDVIPA